jgi:hypothetical protein
VEKDVGVNKVVGGEGRWSGERCVRKVWEDKKVEEGQVEKEEVGECVVL